MVKIELYYIMNNLYFFFYNYSFLIHIFIIATLFSIQPHIKKNNKILNTTSKDSMFINQMIQSLIMLIYYLSSDTNIDIKNIKIKNICLSSTSVILVIYQTILYNKIINQSNVSKVIPMINSTTGIMSMIISNIFFNEIITKKHITGIIFITSGSYLLY